MNIFNLVGISIVLLLVSLVIFFIWKEEHEDINTEKEIYTIEYLLQGMKDTINAIQNTNLSELNLNKVEAKKREEQKAKLYQAVKYCCTGDIGQKIYLKEFMEEILQRKYGINDKTIDGVIPFARPSELTVCDKFDILLYTYKKSYPKEAFKMLCEDFNFDQEKEVNIDEKYEYELEEEYSCRWNKDKCVETYYSITSSDIEHAFSLAYRPLRFIEKLDIITQRLYQQYVGHGVIDELREEKSIDGIAGGVSGSTSLMYDYMEDEEWSSYANKPVAYGSTVDIERKNFGGQKRKRYDAIWCFYKGKPIHMAFMSFGSQMELERVTHNLYRNNNPGWMSAMKGYMINDTKDGDRVTCTRPPFSESFSFWIRKFQSSSPRSIESLIVDDGKEEVITLLKYLVKGCLVIVITGEQNSGKTTLLKSLVQFIDSRYPIRTLEIFFELWLSRLYPEKNIAAFRTSDRIDGSDAISLMKKTDGSVLIAGESADFITAAKVVELSLVGTKMTMSTNHAMTTKGLIEYHTSALMSKEVGLYSNDGRAEKSVVEALNFDIHMVKSITGKRYIERITEIIPLDESITTEHLDNYDALKVEQCIKLWVKGQLNRNNYITRDILVYVDGRYKIKNRCSLRTLNKMKANLSPEDYKEFVQWNKGFEVTE